MTETQDPKIKLILCPVDFSDHSHAALAYAGEMARALGAEIIVLHVVEPVIYPVAYGLAPVGNVNYEEEAKAAAQKSLEPITGEFSDGGIKATSLVSSGTSWLRICDLAEEHGIDMIVMATHGLTGLKHVLMGSTAEQVVRHAKCPVLTVKARHKD